MFNKNVLGLLILFSISSLSYACANKPGTIFQDGQKEQLRKQLEQDKKDNAGIRVVLMGLTPIVSVLTAGGLFYSDSVKGDRGLWATLISVPLFMGYIASLSYLQARCEKTDEDYKKLMETVSL